MIFRSPRTLVSLQWAVAISLGLALDTGCSPSSPSPTNSPATMTATSTATASPSASANDDADQGLFRFEATALERVDDQGKTVWRAPLPAEPQRQMAVLGNTVLVWGPHNNLRRFDATTGKQTGLTLAPGQTNSFGVHDDVMVQATQHGLLGVGEKANLWVRPDIFTDSMVVGVGPQAEAVVVFVQRKDGLARAVNLKDGKDSSFPVPKGAMASVALNLDSGALLWTTKIGGQSILMDAENGKPL